MGKRRRHSQRKGFVRSAQRLAQQGVRDPYKELHARIEEDPRELWKHLPPEDPTTVSARIQQRQGKATIVIIGTSPDSCGLTPWNEPGIDEFWALNDAHHLPFMQMEKISRWFQLHQPWRYRRPTPRYGAAHWDWLKEEHHFPIYLQREDEEIPSGVKFPLYEIAKEFLWSEDMGEWLLGRGSGWQRKYFACSFSYMAGLAYYLWKKGTWGDRPLRIEMYGTELAQQTEYYMQRPNTEFWAGIGIGLGVQFYVPQITRILQGVFYAYRYPSIQDMWKEIADKKAKGQWDERNWVPSGEEVDEDNVGEWPEPGLPKWIDTKTSDTPNALNKFFDFEDYKPPEGVSILGGAIEREGTEEVVPEVMPGYGMEDILEQD